MDYGREILSVLEEAGEKGLSVKKIARHVFNMNNSFFSNVSFDEIHRDVASFLSRNSRQKEPIVERTETRGVYRIRMPQGNARQLMLDFSDDGAEKGGGSTAHEDKSLSLF